MFSVNVAAPGHRLQRTIHGTVILPAGPACPVLRKRDPGKGTWPAGSGGAVPMAGGSPAKQYGSRAPFTFSGPCSDPGGLTLAEEFVPYRVSFTIRDEVLSQVLLEALQDEHVRLSAERDHGSAAEREEASGSLIAVTRLLGRLRAAWMASGNSTGDGTDLKLIAQTPVT